MSTPAPSAPFHLPTPASRAYCLAAWLFQSGCSFTNLIHEIFSAALCGAPPLLPVAMATRSAARRAARHASLALQTPQGRTAEARLLRRLPAAAVLRVPAAPSAAARRAGGLAMRPFASSALPPHQVLEMPALSPTMDKGNLAEWNKKEGDRIREGEVLATIETDKSTMAWEVRTGSAQRTVRVIGCPREQASATWKPARQST